MGIEAYNGSPGLSGHCKEVLPYLLKDYGPPQVYEKVTGTDTYRRVWVWRWYDGLRYGAELQERLGVDIRTGDFAWREWIDKVPIRCKDESGSEIFEQMEVNSTYSLGEYGDVYTVRDGDGNVVIITVEGKKVPFKRRKSWSDKREDARTAKQAQYIDPSTGECLPCN